MDVFSDTNRPTSAYKNEELAILQEKLLSALKEISQENFSVSDDTILEKMYVHLENVADVKETLGSCLTKLTDWIENILKVWKQDKTFYDVKKFCIRFIGLIGSFPEGFESFKSRDSLQDFLSVVKSEEVQRDASMFVPSVLSLKMFLSHVQGLSWVLETDIWRWVVAGFIKGRSIYAKRVCIEFLSMVLIRSSKHSEDLCKEVLALICQPLLRENLINIFESSKSTSVANMVVSTEQSQKTVPNMVNGLLLNGAELLCDLLNQMLCDKSWGQLPFKIQMTVVKVVFSSEGEEEANKLETVKLITDVMHNCLYSRDVQTFATLVLLIDLSNCSDKTTDRCPMLHLHSHTDNVLFNVLLERKYWDFFINHCVACLSWCHKLSICDCEECFFFQSSLVNHMFGYLWPLTKYTQFIATSTENLKRTEDLFQKVLKDCPKMSEECRRNYVYLSSQIFFASQGVSGLSRSFNFLSKDKIVKNIYDIFATTLKSLYQLPEWVHAEDSLCINILTVITKTVDENHSFFQQSCQETSDLLLRYIIKVIRRRSDANETRVVVTLLQTLKTIVRINGLYLADHSTHMKPMLVFTDEISLLQTQLESGSWEIRDTALEVFQTMLEISEIASWLFDNVFEKPLLEKIFSMAADDASSYVRASALNFFARSGKLRMFDDMIPSSSLVEQALSSVTDDTMPGVRRAACELISAFYISEISAVDQNKLCATMFAVTTKDLDWEVKKKSLNFWRCVIDKLMIERKIPLDVKCLYFLKCPKEECTSQLVQLLLDLGVNGCLKAIWIGLNDECDLKVAEEAYSIVTHLQGLDEQWTFTETILMSQTDEENEQSDSNLENLKLHPKEFFRLLKTENWEEKLTSRKNWIENSCDDLQTILDHILNVDNKIDDWDHNVVDCD